MKYVNMDYIKEHIDVDKRKDCFWCYFHVGLIVIPWVTEAIVVSQVSDFTKCVILLCCCVVQVLIASYAGIMGGWLLSCLKGEYDEQCDKVWCPKEYGYKILFTPGYLFQMCLPWFTVNVILSIVYKDVLWWQVRMFVWFPLIVYLFGFLMGIIFQTICKKEEEYSEEK